MDSVQLVLADTIGPFSTLIKARFGGPVSHTAMITRQGVVVEATVQKGVHESSLQSLLDRSRAFMIVSVPVANSELTIAIQNSMLGLPYDKAGALGLGFNRDWQEEDSFWCSETNYKAIHDSGNHYYRAEAKKYITPRDLFVLDFEILKRYKM